MSYASALNWTKNLDNLHLAAAELLLNCARTIWRHNGVALIFNYSGGGVDCDLSWLGGLDGVERLPGEFWLALPVVLPQALLEGSLVDLLVLG